MAGISWKNIATAVGMTVSSVTLVTTSLGQMVFNPVCLFSGNISGICGIEDENTGVLISACLAAASAGSGLAALYLARLIEHLRRKNGLLGQDAPQGDKDQLRVAGTVLAGIGGAVDLGMLGALLVLGGKQMTPEDTSKVAVQVVSAAAPVALAGGVSLIGSGFGAEHERDGRCCFKRN